MIRQVYYNFWIDGIKAAQKNSELGEIEWKVLSLLFVSLAMAFNALTVIIWIELLITGPLPLFIEFQFLPGTMLDSALSFFVTLLWPFLLLNYLLIFRHNRYEQLMEKYPGYNTGGWASMIYFIASGLLFIVPIL
ncbi:MAG: hypothetical protein GF372_06600, partial [Candidatus Marinimicrobia bacterium]|nr:hypothetical protein [Candidatus Neomarinimicrobiota bacterium]